MSHQEDCFYAAVSMLAAHGRVKQRLIKAYEDHLTTIDESDLPAPAQERFAELRRQMHSVAPANGESPICASVRKMSKFEADDCALAIVELFRDVMRFGGGESRPVPVSHDGVELPPPFLVKSG